MTFGRKLRMLLGTLVSPITLLLFRVTKSAGLLPAALRQDPWNMHAWTHLSARRRGDSVVVAQMAQAFKLAAALPPDPARQIKRLAAQAEGQLLQDVVALLVAGEKQGGYFVEVGVGEGRRISNSYMLERDFGWTGLLVEPNRSSHGSIAEHRTAILCKEAAFKEDGLTLTFDEHEDGEYSRLAGTEAATGVGAAKANYDVETATLNTLLDRHGAPEVIDFISIDTEGSEAEVLEGLDPARWHVRCFAIEHNYETAKLASIEAWMAKSGYRRAFTRQFDYDCVFIHRDDWPVFLSEG